MNYQSIDDIYNGNAKIRERLKGLLASLSGDQVNKLPDGEKWTLGQVVEHIAIVDESTVQICAKLLKKAETSGRMSNGKVTISDNFLQKASEIAVIKVEAPDFVKPVIGRTITESLAKLDETADTLAQMRSLFDTVDGTEAKFPHPFFGEISAQEWLALKGGHELRHLKQIEKLIAKL